MNVREIAFECLCNIIINKSYANIDLNHTILKNNLNSNDTALLTQIVYGTLQHQNILKWEINKYLTGKKLRPKITILLMLSLFQLRYLDKVPAYAIINDAVNIAKKLDGEAIGKFSNAILRKLSNEKNVLTLDQCKDYYEYYYLQYNIPTWLTKMWERYYGKEICKKIIESSNIEMPLTFRVNSLITNKEKVLENKEFKVGNLSKDAVILTVKKSPKDLYEFRRKMISIQDEASQMVSLFLNPLKDEKVLDMCAAPGSKTLHMAQLMENQGKILAIDLHEHRVELLKKAIEEMNINNVVAKCADSTTLDKKLKLNYFDKILLDAPCSGLGVIAHKSDILFDLNEEKIDEIVLLQEKLLDVAAKLLKKDGILVYSTCTINKKENELQTINFLSKHKNMKKIEEKQYFPFEYQTDGFYMVKFIKESE